MSKNSHDQYWSGNSSSSQKSHVYIAHQCGDKMTKPVNTHCIEKSHRYELVNQSKHHIICSEPIQHVSNVIHVNRLEVLTNEMDDLTSE